MQFNSTIVNDLYYSGANHVPDLLVVIPEFANDQLQAFCTNIVHKPDIGGLIPGSSSPDAREIYHEGLLLLPVKFQRQGETNTDIERIIRNNSRTSDVTMGDIRGQVGCTEIGSKKLRKIFDDYGAKKVREAAEALLDSTR